MGISLVPKEVALNVNGKVTREAKSKFTNSDLPFPADSFAADLKFWQTVLLPEFIEWIGTLEDAFAANADPEFKATVKGLWAQHFGAYTITDAVYGMVSQLCDIGRILNVLAQAAAAVRNWRSKIGKVGVKAVDTVLSEIPTIEKRAQFVQDSLVDSRFVYEDGDNEVSYIVVPGRH